MLKIELALNVRLKRTWFGVHTVTKEKFGDAGKIHGNAAKEIVVATQANETLWSNGSLEAAKDKYGRSVWDQKTDEAEQCWITYQSC
jgi:hypothetical protein